MTRTGDLIVDRQLNTAKAKAVAAVDMDLFNRGLPNVEQVQQMTATLTALKRDVDTLKARPATVKVLDAPKAATPKKHAPRVPASKIVATAIAAEIVRRLDQTAPEEFIRQALESEHARRVAKHLHKAATDLGTTTTPGFAAELVQHVNGSYFETMDGESVIGQLINGTARRMDFLGGNSISYPTRNEGTLPADWIGEGGKINVKPGSFTSATANRYKLAVMAVVSNELRRVPRPEIVGVVESAIIRDTGVALDGFLLDDTAASAGLRPAGLRLGATTQASAGATIEQVHADLKWMLQHFIGIKARTPRILINPLLVASLTMKTTTGTGISPFAADLARGTLAGIPLVISPNAAVDQVIGIDANSMFIGVDGPEFDTSDNATVLMSPDGDGTAPEVSMFQMNSLAIRFVQPTSWAFARTGTVAVLGGVAW